MVWDALDVALSLDVSLCCSLMVVVVVLQPDTGVLGVLKPVVPIKDGKNGETARG